MSTELRGLRTLIYPTTDLAAASRGGPSTWVSLRTSMSRSTSASRSRATNWASCRPTRPGRARPPIGGSTTWLGPRRRRGERRRTPRRTPGRRRRHHRRIVRKSEWQRRRSHLQPALRREVIAPLSATTEPGYLRASTSSCTTTKIPSALSDHARKASLISLSSSLVVKPYSRP